MNDNASKCMTIYRVQYPGYLNNSVSMRNCAPQDDSGLRRVFGQLYKSVQIQNVSNTTWRFWQISLKISAFSIDTTSRAGGFASFSYLKLRLLYQVLKTKNSTGLSWNCCQKLIFDFVRGGRGTKNNARRALFLLYQIENGKRTPNKLKLTSKTNFKPHKKDRLRLNYRYEYRLQIPAVHCNNYYS